MNAPPDPIRQAPAQARRREVPSPRRTSSTPVFDAVAALLRAARRADAACDPAHDLQRREVGLGDRRGDRRDADQRVAAPRRCCTRRASSAAGATAASVHYRVADPVFVEICRSVCVRIAARIDAQSPLAGDLLDYARARLTRRACAIDRPFPDASVPRRTRRTDVAARLPASARSRAAPRSPPVRAAAQDCAEPAAERSRLEPHARRAGARVALRRAVEVRGERAPPREPRPHAHAAFVGRVHAAAEPVRHHHAVGPALRAPPRRACPRSIRTSTG